MVSVDFEKLETDIRMISKSTDFDLNIKYDSDQYVWIVTKSSFPTNITGISMYLGVAIAECLSQYVTAMDRSEMAAEAMAWAGYTDYGDSEEE